MRISKVILLAIFLLSSTLFSKALDARTFEKSIKTHKVVLVKFWAPWCGACKMLAPRFDKAKKIAGKKVLFATYNVDLRGEPISRYGIKLIPTMILFVDGKEVDRSTSMLNANDISSWVLGYVAQ
jgi:thioredoxin